MQRNMSLTQQRMDDENHRRMTMMNTTSNASEKQLRQVNEQLKDHAGRFDQLMEILDEKMDRAAIEALLAGKIGKEEVTELMPNMEAYENKTQSRIEEAIEKLEFKLEEKLIGWDKRMISIR